MDNILVSKEVNRGFIGAGWHACLESRRSWVHRWWVSVLVSKAVDSGIIGGVMVSVLVSKAVDRGFIEGIMVSVCVRSWVHRWRND